RLGNNSGIDVSDSHACLPVVQVPLLASPLRSGVATRKRLMTGVSIELRQPPVAVATERGARRRHGRRTYHANEGRHGNQRDYGENSDKLLHSTFPCWIAVGTMRQRHRRLQFSCQRLFAPKVSLSSHLASANRTIQPAEPHPSPGKGRCPPSPETPQPDPSRSA